MVVPVHDEKPTANNCALLLAAFDFLLLDGGVDMARVTAIKQHAHKNARWLGNRRLFTVGRARRVDLRVLLIRWLSLDF